MMIQNKKCRITFCNVDSLSNQTDSIKSANNPGCLSLYNNDINFLKYIPRDFMISTQNGFSKFNSEILRNISSTIDNFLIGNPRVLQYDLNIKDDDKVLGKYEQLCLGETVHFDEKEMPSYYQIQNLLNLDMPTTTNRNKFVGISFNANIKSGINVSMTKKSLLDFIKFNYSKKITIITNNNEYQCNALAVVTSQVISEQIAKKSDLTSYVYQYDDEFNDFQPICDFFNFKNVDLAPDNMNSIKDIAEDLKIDVILEKVNQFINNFDNLSQLIDDQQEDIDSIDNLFNLLCHINESSVLKVKNEIVDSFWSRKEDDVRELAAFLIQIINNYFLLHHYLVDLLVELDKSKEEEETKNLKFLLPLISSKMMESFCESFCKASFIYNMYRKGLIPKGDIIAKIKSHVKLIEEFGRRNNAYGCASFSTNTKIHNKTFYIYNWFLPEIIELGSNYHDTLKNDYREYDNAFFNQYLPDKIDKYREMLDNGESDNEMIKALIHDDVDTLQALIAKNQVKNKEDLVPFNIFFDTRNFLNASAIHGSIKCFKYFLLNHFKVNSDLFVDAISGGNVEIIKIVDQQNIDEIYQNEQKKQNNNTNNIFNVCISNDDYKIDSIIVTIKMHKNDLFDWLLEKIFSKNNLDKRVLNKMILTSLSSGNIHSFIALIDKGFNEFGMPNMIQTTTEYGFYRLSKFILKIIQKMVNSDDLQNCLDSDVKSVLFGNLSIFKLCCSQLSNSCLSSSLKYAVMYDYISIVHYFFDTLLKENYQLDINTVQTILNYAIDKSKNDLFLYLLEQIKIACPSMCEEIDWSVSIMPSACMQCKFEIVKSIVKIIIENKEKESKKKDESKSTDTSQPSSSFNKGNDKSNNKGNDKSINKGNDKSNNKGNDKSINKRNDNLNNSFSSNLNYYFNYYRNKTNSESNNDEVNGIDFNSSLFYRDYLRNRSKSVANKNKNVIRRNDDHFSQNAMNDYSNSFINAALGKSYEICKYLIDNKLPIKFDFFINKIDELSSVSADIFKLIIDNCSPAMKSHFVQMFLIPAIKSKNKELVVLLLKEDAPLQNCLVEAVKVPDIGIVNAILEHCSDPSFVNMISPEGTVLNIAAKKQEVNIFKRLLSVPGIDPNLYDKDRRTPLQIAVSTLNPDLVEMIVDFYSDDVQINPSEVHVVLGTLLDLFDKLARCINKKLKGNNNNFWNCSDKSSSSNGNNNNNKNKLNPWAGVNNRNDNKNKNNFNHWTGFSNKNDNDNNLDDNNDDNPWNSLKDSANSNETKYRNKEQKTIEYNNEQYKKVKNIFNQIIRIKNINPNYINKKGTFLTVACSNGDIDIVKALLNLEGIDLNLYLPFNGNTPLIEAASKGYKEIFELLINHPMTKINAKNYMNQTALFVATENQNIEIIDLLINNEKLDPKENDLNNLFFISSNETAKHLIKSKFVDVNYQPVPNETKLIKAISSNDIELVELILNHPSFDKKKSLIEPALFNSIISKREEIFKKLLKVVDDEINCKNEKGERLLLFAFLHDCPNIFNDILSHPNVKFDGIDFNKLFIDSFVFDMRLENNHKVVPIETMKKIYEIDQKNRHSIDLNKLLPNGKSLFTSISPSIVNVKELVQFFLENGADPNMPDKNGIYPLEYAIKMPSFDYFIALVKSNKIDYSVKIQNKSASLAQSQTKNETYLHLAARSYDTAILSELLKRKLIDVNVTNDLGETPLMEACRHCKANNIGLLFKCDDLDYRKRNNEGLDAINIAFGTPKNDEQIKNKDEYLDRLYKSPLLSSSIFHSSISNSFAAASNLPSVNPFAAASNLPSVNPFAAASNLPSVNPFAAASNLPSVNSFSAASNLPSVNPFAAASNLPSVNSFAAASNLPSVNSFAAASNLPSVNPFSAASNLPSVNPFSAASNLPSVNPFSAASNLPSVNPFSAASNLPSVNPFAAASNLPSVNPFSAASNLPSVNPFSAASNLPSVNPFAAGESDSKINETSSSKSGSSDVKGHNPCDLASTVPASDLSVPNRPVADNSNCWSALCNSDASENAKTRSTAAIWLSGFQGKISQAADPDVSSDVDHPNEKPLSSCGAGVNPSLLSSSFAAGESDSKIKEASSSKSSSSDVHNRNSWNSASTVPASDSSVSNPFAAAPNLSSNPFAAGESDSKINETSSRKSSSSDVHNRNSWSFASTVPASDSSASNRPVSDNSDSNGNVMYWSALNSSDASENATTRHTAATWLSGGQGKISRAADRAALNDADHPSEKPLSSCGAGVSQSLLFGQAESAQNFQLQSSMKADEVESTGSDEKEAESCENEAVPLQEEEKQISSTHSKRKRRKQNKISRNDLFGIDDQNAFNFQPTYFVQNPVVFQPVYDQNLYNYQSQQYGGYMFDQQQPWLQMMQMSAAVQSQLNMQISSQEEELANILQKPVHHRSKRKRSHK